MIASKRLSLLFRSASRRFQLRHIQLTLPLCLVATSGCASFFGPYSSDYEAASPQQQQATEKPVVEVEAKYPPTAKNSHLQPLTKPDFAFSNNNLPQDGAADFAVPREATYTPHAEAKVNPFAEMAQAELTQTALAVPTSNHANSDTSATTFHAAQPRMPTAQDHCPPASEFTVAASPYAEAYPEEYIFDGGDRDHPVHYRGGEMAGLDTEDTVAEFKDENGKNHVKASNRVAVYAPRFGAIRTVAGPGIDIKVDKAAGATDIAGIDSLNERVGLDTRSLNTPASGLAMREGASGIEIAQPAHLARKSDSAFQNNKVDRGLESKTAIGMGLLEMSTIQELNLQIVEPATSDIKTGFGQTAATTQATQVYATFRLQATVGTEKNGRKGEIHITKEASPLVAKSGDIITFKINFRNIGDYNIHDVRIIDNLTPRLQYVEGTGQIDTPGGAGGGLTAVPNREGSQTLEFTLDEPLKGGDSGTLTFNARVL